MNKVYTSKKLILEFLVTTLTLFFLVIFSGKIILSQLNQPFKKSAMIGEKVIQVEIVSTTDKLIKGLSGRKSLADNTGMLFDFGNYHTRTFWMKDMNFPLDIIWISGGKIVGIDKNLSPESNLPKNKYYSPGPVNQVLEVNGGWCDRNQIMIGQSFYLIDVDKNY